MNDPDRTQMLKELLQSGAFHLAGLAAPMRWTRQELADACLVEIGDRELCTPRPPNKAPDQPALAVQRRLRVTRSREGCEELVHVTLKPIRNGQAKPR